jgi:hypothetical protein
MRWIFFNFLAQLVSHYAKVLRFFGVMRSPNNL